MVTYSQTFVRHAIVIRLTIRNHYMRIIYASRSKIRHWKHISKGEIYRSIRVISIKIIGLGR